MVIVLIVLKELNCWSRRQTEVRKLDCWSRRPTEAPWQGLIISAPIVDTLTQALLYRQFSYDLTKMIGQPI